MVRGEAQSGILLLASLTLTLGIAANTAMFRSINAMVLLATALLAALLSARRTSLGDPMTALRNE